MRRRKEVGGGAADFNERKKRGIVVYRRIIVKMRRVGAFTLTAINNKKNVNLAAAIITPVPTRRRVFAIRVFSGY
jgi:hypothetical protein